jgi:gluconokinase
MKMKYIIGVDIGTTSVKSVAFDLNGKELSKKEITFPILNYHPSWSEQDPNTIFKAIIKSIKETVVQGKENGELLAVSFSSAMHSVIAVDADGKNLTNSIIWADTRSYRYAQDLKGTKIGHRIYMKTGTPIHPMSPLFKLMWMRDNMPEIFKKAKKYLSIKEFVFNKLFDRYVIDHSMASATGLFDIYNFDWYVESLKVAGITSEQLSSPVDTTYILKGLSEKYAKYMDIDVELPFVIGATDGCLANLGSGVMNSKTLAVTIGTSGAIRTTSREPLKDQKERIFNYILTKNFYVTGGSVNNGGIILKWFRDNFSKSYTYSMMMDEISKIPAGSDSLIFLPYLLGERAPHWNAKSKGVFFGVGINHGKAHFMRSVIEGITYGLYDVGNSLEEKIGKMETIHASGGFARSVLWLQILADVFDKKVVTYQSTEGSAFGAFILGMKALGLLEDFKSAEKLLSISIEFIPDMQNHEIHMRNFRIYRKLYEDLKDDFDVLETFTHPSTFEI